MTKYTRTYTDRDQYGRSRKVAEVNARPVVVRIAIPKRTRHIAGAAYIVADWVRDTQTRHQTLAAANAHFDALLAEAVR